MRAALVRLVSYYLLGLLDLLYEFIYHHRYAFNLMIKVMMQMAHGVPKVTLQAASTTITAIQRGWHSQ